MTFNRKVDVALPLTSDAGQIAEALSSEPKLGPSTHVQDAVAAAVRMLDEAGITAGSVVLLSDGADTGSAASLADVTALARGAGVRVFAVGLRSKDFNPRALRRAGDRRRVRRRRQAPRAGADLRALRGHSRQRLPASLPLRRGARRGAHGRGPGRRRPGRRTGPLRRTGTVAGGAKPAEEGGFWKATGTMLAAIAIAAALLGVSLFVLARPQREAVRDRLARFVQVRGDSDDPLVPS